MTRMLKILSAAALALLAVGALSVASASAAEFHSNSEKTVTTGEQDATEGNQVFVAAGSTITCKEARFEATTTTPTNTKLTFKPLLTTSGAGTGYSNCTFFGVPVTVNMHSCDFVFNSNNLIDIECGAGAENYISYKATVFGASCEVRVTTQTGLSKATYTNIGAGTTAEVTTDVAISGIKYDAIGSLCNPAGLGQTNGTYTGKVTATGEVDGTVTHTGISWS
jgi:hypothetical protein